MCHICISPHRYLRFDRAKKNRVTVERLTFSLSTKNDRDQNNGRFYARDV